MIRNYPAGYPLPFVGRSKELAAIAARLQDPACRLLTLTGLGGSGKTRLALEAAKLVDTLFPDGVVFVGLQPVARSDALVPAIGQAAGVPFFGRATVSLPPLFGPWATTANVALSAETRTSRMTREAFMTELYHHCDAVPGRSVSFRREIARTEASVNPAVAIRALLF